MEAQINPDFKFFEKIKQETDKFLNLEEVTGEQLLSQPVKEIPCLIYPFFQKTGLACLAGSSDTGKSMILRQLAISISAGEPDFLGFKINARYNSVIYVSTEDMETETNFLLHKQAHQYTPARLRNLRFVFDVTELIEELDRRLTASPADLIIVDCFSDAYGNDLKDTQKIRQYLHTYQELAAKHQCLVLFLHHTGKRTEGYEPSKNHLLSGQGFEAKMRLVIELRADNSEPDKRHFCVVKGNYLPKEYKHESYVLCFDESTFTFTNTGERTPFELLSKQPESGDNGKAKYEQALDLKSQGLSYAQIADKMGYSSKSSIAALFDKAKKQGWQAEEEPPF